MFSDEGIDGGFFKSQLSVSVKNGSALVIFYSNNLEDTKSKIETLLSRYFLFLMGDNFILKTLIKMNMLYGRILIDDGKFIK